MLRDSQTTLMTGVPTSEQAAHAVDQTRQMFNRTLACWASDMLGARRAGVTHIVWQPPDRTTVWRQAA